MLTSEEVGSWDLDLISEELIKRNFQSNFIDSTLRQRISDFHDQLT